MSNQLVRSFKIIELLSENGPMEIDSIYERTKIPKSSIFKLLNSLENMGYVYRERGSEQSDFWYLTLRFLKISRLILSRLDLKEEVRDILEQLARDVNEIVQLGIYNRGKVMYIDIIKKPDSIISFAGIGRELDINISAAGMVLASNMGKEEIDALMDGKTFPKNTEFTLIEHQDIKNELKQVAKNGYAYDDQQYAIGVRCLAAPIFNFEEKVIGAINITGHISTMTDGRIDSLRNRLLEASIEASNRMGSKKQLIQAK